MIQINNSTVAVETDTELKNILEQENEITYIYLANNITLTRGINVLGSKKQVTIDGLYPINAGMRHTYTDMNSASYVDTIFINSASSINITLKNMIVIGKNYYGIVCVAENSNHTGVVVTYDNLNYVGPQPTYHPSGLSIYNNVSITIANSTATIANEVAETYQLKIGGKSTFLSQTTSYSIFYFRGYSANPFLEILEGAEVTITSAKDLIYTNNPVNIIINKNAKLIINSKNGLFRDIGHQASAITVGENSTFKVVQTTRNATIPTIYCRGAFEINKNATVYIKADYDNSAPLIWLNTPSATLKINDPKLVFLYDRSDTAISFYGQTAPINVTINCKKLDCWQTAPTLNANGYTNITPLYSWQKTDNENLNIVTTSTSTQTTITQNNLTTQETTTLPNLNLFQIGMMKTLRISSEKLSLTSAPTEIIFSEPLINTSPIIMGRKNKTLSLVVEDSRGSSSEWYLYAYIDDDLGTTDKKHSLPSALVFIDRLNITELSKTPLLVYTGSGNNGTDLETTINWTEKEGILLHLSKPIYVGKHYSTIIHWILSTNKL